MSFGKIYETTWFGNPIQNGFGGIYFNLIQPEDLTSFIFTFTTTVDNETKTIPTGGGVYDYKVTTSDGQEFLGVTGNQAITFPTAGNYDVRISVEDGGTFPSIEFNNNSDAPSSTNIKQFGNIEWDSFANAFFGCSITGSFTDAPNLNNVTNMQAIFRDNPSFNAPLPWNFSTINSFAFAFRNSPKFNQPLVGDFSSATNMAAMFRNADDFNQFLDWNIINVTNLTSFLNEAISYDQNLGGLNIINVTNFDNFLNGVTLSTANYDSTLIGFEATLQGTYPNGAGYTPTISFHGGNSKFTGTVGGAAETARTSLINNFSWTITDGGAAPEFLLKADNGFLLQENGDKIIL
jgi:hypothetical protein